MRLRPFLSKFVLCAALFVCSVVPAVGDSPSHGYLRNSSFTSGTRGSGDAKPLVCLPQDVRLDEVVTIKGARRVTVAHKLSALKARCRGGKLVDSRRREIRFFRPSCWG